MGASIDVNKLVELMGTGQKPVDNTDKGFSGQLGVILSAAADAMAQQAPGQIAAGPAPVGLTPDQGMAARGQALAEQQAIVDNSMAQRQQQIQQANSQVARNWQEEQIRTSQAQPGWLGQTLGGAYVAEQQAAQAQVDTLERDRHRNVAAASLAEQRDAAALTQHTTADPLEAAQITRLPSIPDTQSLFGAQLQGIQNTNTASGLDIKNYDVDRASAARLAEREMLVKEKAAGVKGKMPFSTRFRVNSNRIDDSKFSGRSDQIREYISAGMDYAAAARNEPDVEERRQLLGEAHHTLQVGMLNATRDAVNKANKTTFGFGGAGLPVPETLSDIMVEGPDGTLVLSTTYQNLLLPDGNGLAVLAAEYADVFTRLKDIVDATGDVTVQGGNRPNFGGGLGGGGGDEGGPAVGGRGLPAAGASTGRYVNGILVDMNGNPRK